MRPWAFERIPNKIIRGADNALIYTSTKEACLSACLNEVCSVWCICFYRFLSHDECSLIERLYLFSSLRFVCCFFSSHFHFAETFRMPFRRIRL